MYSFISWVYNYYLIPDAITSAKIRNQTCIKDVKTTENSVLKVHSAKMLMLV